MTNAGLTLGLVAAVILWGGSNAGTKYVVAYWPPIWTGASRFLCAGLLSLCCLRWLGPVHPIGGALHRRLWLRGGLSLATYIVTFNWALRYTSVSHVALYLGAAPVWALLWEGAPERNWRTVQRYSAATLALGGVVVLNQPALARGSGAWFGELLGLAASLLWTNYSRQCRALAGELSGAEISAHTMWRAGMWLLPVGLFELYPRGLIWRANLAWVQTYCIVAGGVVTFALWNRALRYWPASQVLLFNNLIPLSTMTWAYFTLGESITPTFWLAMILVLAGVFLGQTVRAQPAVK